MAITAVFPIRTAGNEFWSSPEGLSCIEKFLSSFRHTQGIDRFVVNTDEAAIVSMSRKNEMDFTSVAIPGCVDSPYTYKQSRRFAESLFTSGTPSSDVLIIVDHRNLLLHPEDIEKAVHVFRDELAARVLSLTLCREYPCQYRSFYDFLGCVVLKFGEAEKTGTKGAQVSDRVTINCKKYGKLTVSYSMSFSEARMLFQSEKPELTRYAARMVPFDASGLQHNDYRELFISEPRFGTQIKFDTISPSGMVLFLSIPSRTGEYDAVEIFAPSNAPWRLGGDGDRVVDAKTLQPLLGRQQFSAIYAYDGSICVFSKDAFSIRDERDPIFIILENTCFTSDRVHYLQLLSG